MMTASLKIYNKVKDFIIDKSLIFPGDRVLLSLSAGKDSMTMLHIMMKLREELGFNISIFHLNHMMRGIESDKDEEHVRDLGRNYGIECHVRSYNFLTVKKQLSFEEYAREVRYRLLKETADLKNYQRIATAHSLDDHVETIVMRLFTGTGIFGLRGIPFARGKIIRPLIKIKSDEIYEFLEENKFQWREDSTNRKMNILRNNIRHNLIPGIKNLFPAYDKILERLSEQAEENNELLEYLFSQSYNDIIRIEKDETFVKINEFSENEIVLKYIIAYVLRNHFNEFPSSRMLHEAIRNIKRNRSNLLVYSNSKVTIKKINRNRTKLISFAPGKKIDMDIKDWEYEVEIGNQQQLEIRETGMLLEIDTVDFNYYKKKPQGSNIFVSIDTKICSIIIRNRRNGDRILLSYGSKKIKDILIEKKLDNVSKNCVPLIIINSSVAACLIGIINGQQSMVAADNLITDKSERILTIRKICR